MQTREWDAVIIGGGVAGLSAAQMLGRARRRTLVLDDRAPRNRFAAHMHGVLGHDGIDPAALLARGRDEAAAYGVLIESATVSVVHDDRETLRIVRADGSEERARAIVVATGIRDDLPAIPGLAPLWGRSVLHCPYCHGWEVAGQRLGVLATSPASIHQIELVRQWSDDVTAFTALAEPLAPEVRARLIARDIRIVSSPVHSALVEDGALTGLRDTDGIEHGIDALFVAPVPVIPVDFLAELGLAHTDLPGEPITSDPVGATSHPRVWAAGNVTAPFGNVPLSMGAGSMAGAAVNAALVAEDAVLAVAQRRALRSTERNAAWEQRYAAEERIWSGRVNATFAAVAGSLAPGTALDVGCGEGADAVWLAEHGWQVTGVDVSPTAVRRATDAARARGLSSDEVRFVSGDADDVLPASSPSRADGDVGFDLVTASFLHSWEPDFPRYELLRAAAARVAPGGHLLVISHAAPPPWVHELPAEAPPMHSPSEELTLLGLDAAIWTPEIVEVRSRETTSPDGGHTHLDDGVLLLRRAG